MSNALQPHLDAVRQRVRFALATELTGRLLAGAAAVFWVGFLADRWFEPPPIIRQAAWIVVGVAAVVWLGYTCLLPLFRPLPDRVVALWIERHRPELRESLATVTEDRSGDVVVDRSLIDAAEGRAAAVLANNDASKLVRFDRPRRWIAAAAVGLAAIGCFAMLEPTLFGVYMKRLALAPEPWPRRVSLTVEGFAVEADGRRVQRVALGSETELVARADLTDGHIAPPNVEIRRNLAAGGYVDAVFSAVGAPTRGSDAHQRFRFTVERVEAETRLSIRGGDAQLGPLFLVGERRPQVVDVELQVLDPAYLGGAERRLAIGALDAIPEGATVNVHAKASKPLSVVEATSQSFTSENPARLPVVLSDDGESFSVACPTLVDDTVLSLRLVDRHGIEGAEPYPVALQVVRDRLPSVRLAARGLGPTVTPSACIATEVAVEDDHSAIDANLAISLGDSFNEKIPVGPPTLGPSFRGEEVIDLLTFSATYGGVRPSPGQRLALVASARDRHDLDGQPRRTNSQQIELTIVSPEALLARLEQREINLRQIFESTVESVRRAVIGLDRQAATSDAGTSDQGLGLRVLRATDELSKAAQETLASADAFDQVYLELVNNRIPNDDLKDRIKSLIATPLRKIGQGLLPAAKASVEPLADSPDRRGEAIAASRSALRAMESVLEQMRSLETYNEVVSMLRQIIDEQQSINDATKRVRRDGLRRLLLD